MVPGLLRKMGLLHLASPDGHLLEKEREVCHGESVTAIAQQLGKDVLLVSRE